MLERQPRGSPAGGPRPRRRTRLVLILLACDLGLGLLAVHRRAELRRGRRQIERLESEILAAASSDRLPCLALATEGRGRTICVGPAAGVGPGAPGRNRWPAAASNRGGHEARVTIQKGDHR
jgi:hypothetical protein